MVEEVERDLQQYFQSRTLWNCFKCISENISCTNNSAEGWHNDFVLTLNVSRPNDWKCIDSFKKEIKSCDYDQNNL